MHKTSHVAALRLQSRRMPGFALGFFALICTPWNASGQGIITTIAGRDSPFLGSGRPATDTRPGALPNVISDARGNFYFSDTENNLVVQVRDSDFVGLFRWGKVVC